MRRVIAGVAVLLSAVLVVLPADAQTYIPHWSPDTVEVAESSGEVVLTLKKFGPGHVRYRTGDGSCTTGTMGLTTSDTTCQPPARASDDYGAVSGDVIFTEAGSKKITIPILDDDLGEGYEAFSVYAHEVDDRPGSPTGSTAVVWILDDDGDADCRYPPCSSEDAGEPAAATTTTAARRQPSSLSPVSTLPGRAHVAGVRVPPATTAASSDDLNVELAAGELRPGPGFELTSDGRPEPAPEGGGGASGGAGYWLATALGAAAVGAGVVAWLRRRTRWSPTRS